jgi:hypothetical protein
MKEAEIMADIPKINVISTKRACEILEEHGLKTNPAKLGLGLQQKVYPFGVAIRSSDWIYEIYEHLLMNWIRERAG